MAYRNSVIVLLFYLFNLNLSQINCELINDGIPLNNDNNNDVVIILNHLNSLTHDVYYYKNAKITNIKQKADIIEYTIDVKIECNKNNYPQQIPCYEKLLICHAFVQQLPNSDSRILGEIQCEPKPDILTTEILINNNDNSTSPFTETTITESSIKSFVSYNQDGGQSAETSGEHFIAYPRNSLCLGCSFTLDKENQKITKELVDLAIKHINSENTNNLYKISKINQITQEIINGVRYIMYFEVYRTNNCENSDNTSDCPTDVNNTNLPCRVVFLQKPWINNDKNIITNNCTITQEFNVEHLPSYDENTERKSFPFMKKQNNIMTPSRLLALESQILDAVSTIKVQTHSHFDDVQAVDDTPKNVDNTEPAITMKTKNYDNEENQIRENKISTNQNQRIYLLDKYKITDNVELFPINKIQSSINDPLNNSEFSDIDVIMREKRSIGHFEKISPYEKNLVRDLADFAAATLDNIDDDNNKRVVLQILGAKKMISDGGTIYHLILRLGISGCLEDKPSINCREQLFKNYTKICKIQIHVNEERNNPKIIKSQCQNIKKDSDDINRTNYSRYKRYISINNQKNFKKFQKFMEKFNKIYPSKMETKYRFKVFQKNMKFASVLNKYEQGTAKYGETIFADLTRKEFSKLLGYRPDLRLNDTNEVPFIKGETPNIDLPVEFDWRDKNAVTPIKNQGMCGSCWAFSVTGNVEGQYAIKYGRLLEFSEQELVDCDKVDEGCNGGLMDNAYRVIENLGGLETETDYPYDARNEKCNFKPYLVKVQLAGAVNISHNETDMAKWLVYKGPISIAINANAMQFYMGGISHPLKFLCNPKSLDHGVLIVGYGLHHYQIFNKTLPYWIIKNSWGKSWGEQGYYKVYRGDGTCGLNATPSSSIIKNVQKFSNL